MVWPIMASLFPTLDDYTADSLFLGNEKNSVDSARHVVRKAG